MTVTVHRATTGGILTDAEVARVTAAALARGGRGDLAVDVILVDDATLAELHGRFLGDPTPTDVIAFDLDADGLPSGDPQGPESEGPAAEIYVSVERAARVALDRSRDAAAELALYLVHGALHLCGHDDHEERACQRMRAAEGALLLELGYAVDPELHGT